MNTKLLLSILALSLSILIETKSFGQSFFNSDYGNISPNTNVINQGTDANVNEFTGQINYSINVSNLKINGSSFPISLIYTSNGIKVDQYASNVGLGWNLSAGGSISKVTVGTDDDLIGPNNTNIGFNTPLSIAFNSYSVYSGLRDGGKDYYVYNFFGISGRFYKLNSNQFQDVDGNKIQIEFDANTVPNGRFIITDYLGVKLNFSLKETISTFREQQSIPSHTTDGNWYLTSINFPDGKSIMLNYESKVIDRLKTSVAETQSSLYNYNSAINPPSSNCSITGCGSGTQPSVGTWYTTYNGFRIRSIETDEQKIVFNYSNIPRTDVPTDYPLISIQEFVNDALKKQLNLVHSYLSGRLVLSSIIENTSNFNLSHRFAEFSYYNDFVMPAPYSMQSQDLMGYFNGEQRWINCSPSHPLPSLIPWGGHDISGANRTISHHNISQTLMLRKITDKYGSVQEIQYENNLTPYLSQPMGSPPIMRDSFFYGLRVARVVSYNLTEPSKKMYRAYEYKHSSGNYSSGVASFLFTDNKASYRNVQGCYGEFRYSGGSFRKIVGRDYLIGYKRIKVLYYTDELNISNSTNGYLIKEYSTDNSQIVNNSTTIESYKCGNLLSVTSYNKQNIIVDKTEYEYTYNPITTYISLEAQISSLNVATESYRHLQYNLNVGFKQLSSVTEFKFNVNGVALKQYKNIYTYDSYNQIIKIEKRANNRIVQSKYLTYPYNYNIITPNDDYAIAVKFMNDNGIKSTIIESVTTKPINGVEYVEASTVDCYNLQINTNKLYIKKEYDFRNFSPQAFNATTPGSFVRLNFNGGIINFSNRFTEISETMHIDRNGNISSMVRNRIPYTNLSKMNGQIYAEFQNLGIDDVAFLGFENYEVNVNTSFLLENWIPNNLASFMLALTNQNSLTGRTAFDFSLSPSLSLVSGRNLNPNKTYILRYWIKQGTLNLITSNGVSTPAKIINTSGNWQLMEHQISQASGVSVTSNNAIIDDLILFASEGIYQYQVFDELNNVTAQVQANGKVEFYEYDALGRLITIRDSDKNIIKRFEFGIQEQQ